MAGVKGRSGRKRFVDEQARWHISLPVSLADAVNEAMHDPVYDKPRYGARNRLIISLLRNWLRNKEEIDRMIEGDLSLDDLEEMV